MLMKCPKCSFLQPEDRFCANCGIDVKAYQVKPLPLIHRLLGHPALWFFIFIFSIFATLFYFKINREKEITQRKEYIKKGPLFIETKPPSETTPNEVELASVPISQPQKNEPSAVPNIEPKNISSDSMTTSEDLKDKRSVDVSSAELPVGNNQGGNSPPNLKSEINVQLTYYEVEEETLDQAFYLSSRASSLAVDFGQYRAGPFVSEVSNQHWTRLKSRKFILSRDKKEEKWVEGNTQPELGFFFIFQARNTQFPFQGELEIVKFLPEEGADIINPISYPNTFIEVAQPKSKWFITLKLPLPLPKTTLDLLKDPIFYIFSSDSFLKMKSDFTLLFEFDTNE